MQEAFQHAFFPPSLRVMGKTLPPLGLWHLAALIALRSPFVAASPETVVTVGDLQLALRICQARPLSPLPVRPRLADVFTRWRYARRWRWHARQFVDWLRAQQITPELWQRVDDGLPRHITSPLLVSKVAALMDLGFSHAEAWSLSPGYAEWLLIAQAERTTPGIKVLTDADRDAMAAEAEQPLLSEEECIALAKSELGPEHFEAWLAARKASDSTPSALSS